MTKNRMCGNQLTIHDKTGRSEADFYPTPATATTALLEHVSFRGPVWEPATGKGHISEVLIANGHKVIETDLHAEKYGRGRTADFLTAMTIPGNCKTIITNPPFSLFNRFMEQGLRLDPETFILHAAAGALGSKGRGQIFRAFPPHQGRIPR